MQRNELVNWANSLGFDATTITNDSKLEAHLKYLQNNGTAVSGTLATQTLTSDATAQSDGDKVTIGSVTYTFKTALSETKASGTLTSDTTAPSDGDTVTIDGITYVFRTTLSNTTGAPYEVLIGASAAAALDNLKSAINDTGTEGTHYGAGTQAHPTVTATTNTDTTQLVVAKDFGTYANAFITVENSSHLSWGGSTLSGGVAPVANEVLLGANAAAMLDNLKSAINDSGTEGTHYSTGTQAHPQVTATTNTDTTQVVEARDYAVTNGSIATTDPTDTGSHMSWGSTTLASGVLDTNAVDATSVAQAGSGTNGNV